MLQTASNVSRDQCSIAHKFYFSLLDGALRMTGYTQPYLSLHAESPGYVDMQGQNSSSIVQQLRNVRGSPRFSLMLALSQGAIKAPFDGASIINSSLIEWLARDSSKPGKLLYTRSSCMHLLKCHLSGSPASDEI